MIKLIILKQNKKMPSSCDIGLNTWPSKFSNKYILIQSAKKFWYT